MTDPRCLHCETKMDPGFIPDATYGGNAQQKWERGVPVTSFWTGLKVNKKALIPVVVYRCPKCGALESYARA